MSTDREIDPRATGPQPAPEAADAAVQDMVCCPTCDLLYRFRQPGFGEAAVCTRCHTVLVAPRRRAGLQIVALAVTVTILVIGATVFPFLSIRAGGVRNDASILDAALAFAEGPLLALTLLVVALIMFIPLARTLLVAYVLFPLVRNAPPARHARPAFRLSERLRAWSMAEIFALGCAVALVKVADLAEVNFGPAFWLFVALVVVIQVQDRVLCRWSVWHALDPLHHPAPAAPPPAAPSAAPPAEQPA